MKPARPDDHEFRIELQREFLRRREKNASYSLRSFSRNLGIYHATLSAILSGRRPVTKNSVKVLGQKIGLPPKKIAAYLSAFATNKSSPSINYSLPKYAMLEDDVFANMSHWYYDAILELVRLPDFNGQPKEIASRLGISVHEARIGVESLLRLKMIRKNEDGSYTLLATQTENRLDENHTTSAHRKLQAQVIDKARIALDDRAVEQRSHTSTTMAIARADLPAIKDMIKQFRRELDAFAQRDGVEFDCVYQLAVSYFELTIENEPKMKGIKK